jgi:hypothetical protein
MMMVLFPALVITGFAAFAYYTEWVDRVEREQQKDKE